MPASKKMPSLLSQRDATYAVHFVHVVPGVTGEEERLEKNLSTTTEKQTSWLQAFESFPQRNEGPTWLKALREDAFARFWKLGFPTTHDEDWRFTSVAPLAATPFQLANQASPLSATDLLPYRLEGIACQLVFVNGHFVAGLSQTGSLPKGVTVESLSAVLARGGAEVEHHLARYESFHDDAFTALNTAFMDDGAYVHIPRGAILEHPICLLLVSTGSSTPQMSHPRNLIVVEQEAQVTVMEDYVSVQSGAGAVLSNVITELIAGDNSVVDHYLVEREDRQAYNISTLRTQQGRTANVASHSILLGGALVRNNVHPVLAGEGGECLINGLFIGTGRQHMDNYMKVEHQAPHCGSRQFYNGILDDHARGVFHGRIIVHKGAQKTDAKQTNRNLLLSDDAQIDTKPQLEIYADDVKCTHGATIGQIEENALFYLRSRGVPEHEARGLLLFAFANESLSRMRPGVVRDWLAASVPEWLPRKAGTGNGSTAKSR
jgi:Fe-S cluster assembly protein SufD